MFNGATFRENLFPLSENVNNYAEHMWTWVRRICALQVIKVARP